MGEGLAWLPGHRPLRALALAAALSNLGLGALFSVFTLFARARLGSGPLGYGVLLAVIAAGGLPGGLAAGRVIPAVGAGPALRAELVLEALSYLGLLLTRSPGAAAALLAFLAANLTLFSSVGAALRQSLAPPGMLVRVQGAYRAVSNGGMLAGAALGGLLTTVACRRPALARPGRQHRGQRPHLARLRHPALAGQGPLRPAAPSQRSVPDRAHPARRQTG